MAYTRTISSSFRAITPDGSAYEILECQTVFSKTGRQEDETPIGDRRLLTRDGRLVAEIGPGQYEISSDTALRVTVIGDSEIAV